MTTNTMLSKPVLTYPSTTNSTATRLAGLLFIVATAAFMAGSGLIDGVTKAPDALATLDANRMVVITGILLQFVNSAAVVGIAILLYPTLKQHQGAVALGYVAFRVIEATLLILGALSPLLLITFSQTLALNSGAAAEWPLISTLVMAGQQWTFQLAMAVLAVGSLPFCILLYRTRLVPRWLALLGLLGYIALLASAVSTLFGTGETMLWFLPGALFEIIFPLWLIGKGFSPAV